MQIHEKSSLITQLLPLLCDRPYPLRFSLSNFDQKLSSNRRRPKHMEDKFHVNFCTIITPFLSHSSAPRSLHWVNVFISILAPTANSRTQAKLLSIEPLLHCRFTVSQLIFSATTSSSTNANWHLPDVSIKCLEVLPQSSRLLSPMSYSAIPQLVFSAAVSLSTNAYQQLPDVSITRLEVGCIHLVPSMLYFAPQYWPLAVSH